MKINKRTQRKTIRRAAAAIVQRLTAAWRDVRIGACSGSSPFFFEPLEQRQLLSVAQVPDNGFANPNVVSNGGYQYNPTGTAWTFTSSAGIEADGSGWGAATAPDGDARGAFIQNGGSISQSIHFDTGTYSITFQAAQRGGTGLNPVQFSVDGVDVGSAISAASTAWASYTTASFTISTAGDHTIKFAGTEVSGDNDTFVDAIGGLQPTGVGAFGSDGQVALSWTSVTGADSYNLYRATTSGGEGSTPYATDITDIEYTDTSVTNGTPYYYIVTAVTGGVESEQGTEASATPDSGGGTPTSGQITDNGFANPNVVSNGSYQYNPTGTAWTFTSSAGIESNGSGWGATNAPDGDGRAAFIQNGGSISQSVYFDTGTYSITFQAAQRGGAGLNPVQLSVSGADVGDPISPSGTAWASYTTSTFTIAIAGYHTVEFTGTEVSGDNDTFVDALGGLASTGPGAVGGDAEVTVSWSAVSGADSYNLYRATTSGAEGAMPFATDITATDYTDTSVTNETSYYYIVTAVTGGVESEPSTEVSATPISGGGVMLTDADMGSPGMAGSASFSDGVYTIAGGGSDIYGSSDQFNFDSTSILGDATMVVQVSSQTDTDSSAKAGLMIRDSSTADGAEFSIVATPGNGISEQWRSSDGGSTSASAVLSGTTVVPSWLEIVRTGDSFAAYYSTQTTSDLADVTWTLLGSSETISMPTRALAGLAVTSHDNSSLSTATFSNFSVTYGIATPTSVVANAAIDEIDLSWSTVGGATSYSIYRSATSGAEGSTPIATGVTATSYADTGLSDGATYYYKVTAANDGDESDPSAEVSATAAAPASLPFSDNFNRVDSSSLGADWTGYAGEFEISGDQALSIGLPYYYNIGNATLVGPSDPDVSVSVDINLADTEGSAGLIARSNDSGEYVGQITASGTAEIGKVIDGSFTAIDIRSVTIPTGSATLTFDVAGGSLALYFNGALVSAVQDSSVSGAGSVGIYATGSGSTFDNFSASALSYSATTASLPFSDSFDTDNGAAIGGAWTQQIGDFVPTGSGVLSAVQPAYYNYAVATLSGPDVSNVSISADVNLVASETSSVGLVARDTGDEMYVGEIQTTPIGFAASIGIYSVTSNSYTPLDSRSISVGSGTLTFEVIGNSFGLFLNGQIVSSVQDSTITSTGGVGIYAENYGVTLSNFSASTASFSPADASLPFSDTFTRSDSPTVGTNWTEQQGDFDLIGHQAQSMAVGEGNVSLATLNDVSAADVTLSATVDLTSTGPFGGGGVAARVSGDSMYVGQLITASHVITRGQILKEVDGTWTTLATKDLNDNPLGGSLRFEVLGTTLKLYLNETLIAVATDSSITDAGALGVYATDSGSRIANFAAATEASPTPADAELPFSDNFNRTGSTILGENWTKQTGDLTVSGHGITSAESGDASATVNGVSLADVTLSATYDLTLSGAGSVGLDARISGSNEYQARVVWNDAIVYAQVREQIDGAWTILDSRAVPASGTLRFDVIGDNLMVYVNGRPSAVAVDSSITDAGGVGVTLHNFPTFADDFAAAAASTAPAPGTASLPFTDNFSRADSAVLGDDWVQDEGEIADGEGQALSLIGAESHVTLNGVSAVDVSISSYVDISAGGGYATAGFDARTDGNTRYRAQLSQYLDDTNVQILQEVDGVWTTLDSRPVSVRSGTLRFDIQGQWLAVYLNDKIVASARDTGITAAGSIGLYASYACTFDNLSITALDAVTPTSASLTFDDSFNRADNGISLGSNWTVQDGDYAIDTDQLVAMASGVSLATVNGISQANVIVSASVNVPANQTVGLLAQYSETDGVETYYMGTLGPDGAQIYKCVAGTLTLLATASATGAAGTLRFETDSGTLQLFLNDVLLVETADTDITAAGTVGVYGNRDPVSGYSDATLDNFLAQAPGSITPVWLTVSSASGSKVQYWAPGVSLTDVHVGDFNGDGEQDVTGYDASTGDWIVGLSNGINGFTTQTWATWSTSVTWTHVVFGDFNGDGLTDIAAMNAATGTWQVALSNGASFATENWGSWSTGATWASVQTADVNGDGRADLVGFDSATGGWQVAISTGTSFTMQSWANWGATADWRNLIVADFDGDGRADVAACDATTGQWHVGISNGNGFGNAVWGTWSTSSSWVDVQAGDFNGDGRADLIGRAAGSDTWQLSLSSGSGFTNATWTTAANLINVQVADINGDGKADLVGQIDGTRHWNVELSQGDSFTDEYWQTFSSALNPSGMVVADFYNLRNKAAADLRWVYNNVQYQPYAGEMKGPQATKETLAGNDWDQDALLVSMLQADGIDAQFVSGRIEVPSAEVELWLGVKDSTAAQNVLTTAGLNPTVIDEGMSDESIEFDHAWAQAYLPGPSGLQWTPMDPSFKFRSYQGGITGLSTSVPFDSADYLAHVSPETPLEYYQDQISGYLAANDPTQSIADVAYAGPIIAQSFQSIPTALPYTIVGTPTTSAAIPSIVKDRVRIQLQDIVFGSVWEVTLDQSFSVPDISLDTITVTYLAVSGRPGWYLPQLRLNGAVVQQGTDPMLVGGDTMRLVIDHYGANSDTVTQTASYDRAPGIVLAVGIDADQYSQASVARLQSQINAESLALATGATTDTAPTFDDGLSLAIMQYLRSADAGTATIDALYGLVNVQAGVGDGVVDCDPSTMQYHWDLTVPLVSPDTEIDIQGAAPDYTLATDGADGQAADRLVAAKLLWMQGSDLESYTLDSVFAADSISAVKGLQIANDAGIPILTIDSSNESAMLSELTIPTGYKTQVQSYVDEGFTVTIPRDLLISSTWSGTVLHVEDIGTSSYVEGDLVIGNDVTHGAKAGWGAIKNWFSAIFSPSQQSSGDPVDTATGSYERTDTDISIPNIGIPLTFARSYVSGSKTDIGLGEGWTDTYSDTITTLSNGDVTWVTSDGVPYTFTPTSGDGYTDPAGIFGTLSMGTDGFVFRDPQGNVRYFNANGRLEEIEDQNGNSLIIVYDESGNITSVTDGHDSSRYLDFATTDGHITSVTDFTGRTWTYTYTTAVNPIDEQTKYFLASCTTPSNSTTTAVATVYAYSVAGPLFGLMTSITDSTDGTTIQLAYYVNGKIFSVTGPQGNTQYFYYDQAHNSATFVDALGRVTVSEFDAAGDTLKQINPDQTRVISVWTNGLLQSRTDPMGRTETFEYDSAGNITRFVSLAGTETDATYDPTLNRPTEITVAGESSTTYTYDTNGNVLTIHDALGDETTMTYNDRGLLLTVTGPNGNVSDPVGDFTTEYTYNDAGQILTVVSGLPSNVTNTYDAIGDLISTTDPDDRTTSYSYDLLGRLLQTTGPDPDGSGPLTGSISTISYDLSSDSTTTTDALGNSTTTFDDRDGRIVRTTNPDGTFAIDTYDAVGNLIASTDVRGDTTQYIYDSEDRKIETLFADGASTLATYNADDQIVASTDANGDTMRYAYNPNGTISTASNALDQTISYSYDVFNNIETITDASGTTMYTRDLLGRITQTRAPGDVISTTDYDADGNIVTQTVYDVSGLSSIPADPRTLSSSRKESTITTYDVLDRSIEVTDPADNHTYTSYYPSGLVASATDAGGATTTYSYDGAGKLISQTGPDPDGSGPLTASVTQYQYDADGNLISETDPLSQTTSYSYDSMNRLVSSTQADPDGSGSLAAPVTAYTYNVKGQQVSITDSDGNTTYYTYDSVGNELAKINSVGSKWTYAYDGNGNLVSTTDADGRTTQFTYDALNRVTAENWIGSDGSTVIYSIAYTYNDKNQLESISDADSSYAYTYDDAGRVLTIDNAGTSGMADVVLAQTYDGFGNRASLSASVGDTTQFTNAYQYGPLGQMTQVTQSGAAVSDKEATFEYNPFGQFTEVARYASTDGTSAVAATSYSYDQANRLISLTHTNSSDSTTIAAYGYTYDSDDQITAMTSPDGSVAYTYDADGRLTGASGSALPAAESYSYDANGNRTNAGDSTGQNNQLATDGTYNYTYDADGDLIQKTTIAIGATVNYTWDYRNRLADVTLKDSEGTVTEHIHYTYDVFNRRIRQQIDSTGSGTYDQVENYIYDGSRLLMTVDGSGSVTHVFLNGPCVNQVLADDAGGGNVSWLLADQQGSIRDVVDGSAASLDHIQYDSYGNIIAQTTPSAQPRFAYAGMQLDQATGLYFDNARYYDPLTGTFISADPSGFHGGSNLHGYTNADPISYVDVTGFNPQYVNIIPGDRAIHILYGDADLIGGGHLYPGFPGKTPFPQSWSAPQILNNVSDILTDPATVWRNQTGAPGAYYTNAGNPAKWITDTVRDGVSIRVVYDPATAYVRTAFPSPGQFSPAPPWPSASSTTTLPTTGSSASASTTGALDALAGETAAGAGLADTVATEVSGVLEEFGGPLAIAAAAYQLYEISNLPPSQRLPALNNAIWTLNGALVGAEYGAEAGAIFGPFGALIGGVAGGIVGAYLGHHAASAINNSGLCSAKG